MVLLPVAHVEPFPQIVILRRQCSSVDEESLIVWAETLRSQRALAQSDMTLWFTEIGNCTVL